MEKNILPIIDPNITTYKQYLKLNINSVPSRRLVLLAILGTLYHILNSYEGPVHLEAFRYLYSTLTFLLVLFTAYFFCFLFFFLKNKERVVDIEQIRLSLKKNRRCHILRTGSNTLLVRLGRIRAVTFCYEDVHKLDKIEEVLRK